MSNRRNDEGSVPLSAIKLHPALLQTSAVTDGKPKNENTAVKNPYLQHLAGKKRKQPAIKPLKLNVPGKFVKQSEKSKEEEELLALMRDVEPSLDTDVLVVKKSVLDYWWDRPFLTDTGELRELDYDEYLYDPEPTELPLALAESITAQPKPLFLTKAERKKIRRERRLAEQRDRQEQIRLGLLPPDQPKQKLSSLITLGTKQLSEVGAAVSEPSAREAAIRQAMAERQAQHEAANQERALDAEGRREKLIKRYREDLTEGQVHCLLIRINSAVTGKDMFKLCANARQNHLLGMLAIVSDMSAVYVEGGPAAVKRYRHLVTSRMPDLQSHVIHEGLKRRPDFTKFHSEISNEFDARCLMEKHGCLEMWTALKSYIPPQ